MYIDVHCHLDESDYGDLSALIAKCGETGVRRLIAVGFDIPSSVFAKNCAEKYESVYFSAGFHPTELSKFKEGDLDIIADLCNHEKCVALGEIGLDYHYPDTNKPLQKEMFIKQLDLAEKLSLPVQIHSRDCAEDMLEIIKERKFPDGALMHCYSHSAEIAEILTKAGLYFSFGGASTWKSSKRAARAIVTIKEERLLTETDSPYMSPASSYGAFPNTPLAIPEILKNMAEIKGKSCEQMQNIVWDNAHRLFKKLG